jgi:hypothetical protein
VNLGCSIPFGPVSRIVSVLSFFCSFSGLPQPVSKDIVRPLCCGSLRILYEAYLWLLCSLSLASSFLVEADGFHRLLATTQPFSVIEEKGEGFENGKKYFGCV